MSRFLQVLLTIAGLGITAILGYASMRSDAQQAQSALLGLFTETLRAARDNCDGAILDIAEHSLLRFKELESSKLFVSEAELVQISDTFDIYFDALSAIKGTIESETCVPARRTQLGGTTIAGNVGGTDAPLSAATEMLASSDSSTAVLEALSRNAETRGFKDAVSDETAVTVPANPTAGARAPGSEGPIAVLASYKFDNDNTYDSELGVSRHFEELQKQISPDENFRLKLLRATVSGHFAIVLEPATNSREDARKLVTTARRNGWAPDAFVQDRKFAQNWAECTNPTSIRSADDC